MERKLYKTKLCILYIRGHCTRQSCSFAHGEAEIRRFGSSMNGNGRREFRGGDLRDKLARRYSPRRRFSPDRDGRGRHFLPGHRHHERGYSGSRSPVSRRGERKRAHLDGEDDGSPDLRTSDLADDSIKEGRVLSFGELDAVEEQLKQAQMDLEMFDDHKCQLEEFLEEKTHEAKKLSAKIEELEIQLEKEQDDCRRFTSKIKKFIKAQSRIAKAQEELKRSQARLQRVCNQFDFDAYKQGNNEEDSSAHALSDVELSPMKKKMRFDGGPGPGPVEEIKGSMRKRERLISSSKEDGARNGSWTRNDLRRHLGDRLKDSNRPPAVVPLTKERGAETGRGLPATSMAAQAEDEFIDLEEKYEESPRENGEADQNKSRPTLPPHPPKSNSSNLSQYDAEDELVDMEEAEVDIGGEVDIEKP